MIEKISRISGIGMLHDSVPKDGGLELSKAVAIYADNGRGKSTFCHLLKSLADNECTEVQARKALRQTDEPSAELVMDGETHTLSEGSWDQRYDRLHVFDERFVEEAVSVGSILGVKHLERMLVLALQFADNDSPEEVEDMLEDCRAGVNARLRELGAAFEISRLARNDSGDVPRADYTLRLMAEEIPLVASEPTLPSFSTVLGPGDRWMLGLALFFYGIDGDRDIMSKTVVLDDPAVGLDRRRKTKLAEMLMGYVQRAQLIVLSHDPEFIKMMQERGFDQVLQLERSGIYCRFTECDIDAILAADYTDRFIEPDNYRTGGHPTS